MLHQAATPVTAFPLPVRYLLLFKGTGCYQEDKDVSDMDTQGTDFSMDATELYREETFTDRRIGTVRRLIPIRPDGSDDNARETLYVGQTQMLTPLGALPLHFEIPAGSLEEAAAHFGAAAQQAAHETIEELKEMRRDAASSIVLPQGGMDGGMGGTPGGGKIQFP